MDTLDYSQLTLTTLFLVYASGFVTSLTPCVYPILPIVVGYLGSRDGSLKTRALASLFYVLGLSAVYALLGMLAVFTGTFFGEYTATYPVYLSYGIFLLILAGSMMDFYTLPIPQFLQPKASKSTPSLFSSFLVGASSGLVASPCTAPVLAGILMYATTQKNYFSGSLLMVVFALGLNTTLLIIGFSTNVLTHLPKSGQWMVLVKKIMGIILIIAGLYFIFKAGQIS